MTQPARINLEGKDWFTAPEAAHYCGVSESQFRRRAAEHGLIARRFMGKQLFARADLYNAISQSPTWHGESVVPRALSSAISPELAWRLRGVPLRPFKPRKKKAE